MSRNMELSLARQLSLVFEELESELLGITGGTLIVCIRNDMIGKFGVKHDALESKDDVLVPIRQGLQKNHLTSFRLMAMEALKRKKHWTHGEIVFDFTLRQDTLLVSTWFESNYNMSNLLEKYQYSDSPKGLRR
ncbi:O-methyltransferase [Paenibacillus aquistagni]|uniref:O-methyltransferase n=1 Tax=Paenibacillus aquistagni TaxID=1852522 RepID=UPI000B500ADC|nr:O-methyltransferase [Paenibacillus aquistagni]NMM53249.1 O-methyltransferase [Paenibacillus aquistagni]